MSETRQIARDERGFPIFLQAGPGVDVPTTRSGNPAHVPAGQPGGGRFGKRTKVDEAVSTRGTGGVTPEELARRFDAVREAAREFEVFNQQDVMEWLRGRINKPFTQAEVDAFLADVRSQQLADLVDVLDQNERGSKRGRRHVRVTAPKGYTRKLLGALEDTEIQMLVTRLRARGWNDSQVKGLASRLPLSRREIVLQ